MEQTECTPRLRAATPPGWIATVLADFDSFLIDHAACERKASATAISLLTHYPDRRQLVEAMAELAREELEHFGQVLEVIHARNLTLRPDRKDLYVTAMRRHIRRGREAYFLDRLLVGGIIEARGCERFGLVADALDEGELKTLYRQLVRSEARHHGLFRRLARLYFDAELVLERERELFELEAEIVAELPLQSALH